MMEHYKLITCVMQEKLANSIIKELQEHKSVITANKFSARGTSFVEHLNVQQMDVLTVLVPQEHANELFTLIYNAAQIDRPHGGLIFQEKVGRSTLYELPDSSELK